MRSKISRRDLLLAAAASGLAAGLPPAFAEGGASGLKLSDPTPFDFNGLAMKGAVLAPYASTTGGAVFDGAFCAKSYTGAREFHLPPFTGTIEPPPLPARAVTWGALKSGGTR